VEDWLRERGIEHERLDVPDERVPAKVRPNIVAVYPGGEKGRTLWLLSHLDVAAAGPRELWRGDPFALRLDGDAMYGRGVEDNNQAIAVSLLLLETLNQTGVKPPVGLGLVITSGALTDYTGIEHVVDQRPDMFGPEDMILVMDYGNAEGSLVSVGEKGNLWLKATVSGREGHAGNPDAAKNALAAGAALAGGLSGLDKKFPAHNALFTPPRVTITPTRTEDYSTGVNHIPAKFVLYMDVRVTPEYSFAEAEKAVRDLADALEGEHGVGIALERVEETAPALVTPDSAPVVAALDRAIRAELGVEPRHIGGFSVTVAATLRNKGLNAAVWGVQETMHNRVNEYALISAHVKQARVIARMLFEGKR
jgi:succinyl-diaminopimelate desuccinylase